nr:aminotransferase class V-fold PLP-dependent enzyme [Micromonospora sp. NBRC 107566]
MVARPEPPTVLGIPGEINLDYAASAPCATAAADAVAELLPWYASVHRGAGALSRRCTLAYERARQAVGDFLGCTAEHEVIFTRNTTDALNLLARALPAGTGVVTFAGEHHANLLPWPNPVRLPVPSSPDAALRSLAAALRELRRGADPSRPLLVAVTGAGNVTGELYPVADLAAVAHRHGARLALDAAQLAPHAPVHLGDLGADYVALSGHKLYAPFGAGVLAGRSDWLDAAEPYLAGGGATRHVGAATHDVRWAGGPARHEAGTPNLLGAVALGAVCETLAAADRAALHAHEQALLSRLRAGLAAIEGVAELRQFDAGAQRVGIVSFALAPATTAPGKTAPPKTAPGKTAGGRAAAGATAPAGRDAAEVTAALARDHGIGVRDGLFCAHPLARRLLDEAAARAGWPAAPASAIRASIGLGSTAEHVDRLIAALREIMAA